MTKALSQKAKLQNLLSFKNSGFSIKNSFKDIWLRTKEDGIYWAVFNKSPHLIAEVRVY